MPSHGVVMSSRLASALKEVEETTGRRVTLVCGESRDTGRFIQGYHRLDGSSDSIWLYSHLPRDASEATAAHELAHVIQASKGYPRAAAAPDAPLENYQRLATAVNNLVLDVNADKWAIRHGFNIGRALSCSGLPEVIAAMKELPVEAGSENTSGVTTMAMGIDYAALKLRLSSFGLFYELDRLWRVRWPQSRSTGRSLVRALAGFNFSSATSCRRAMEKILKLLGMPEGRIAVT
jgi:hypothetical protein